MHFLLNSVDSLGFVDRAYHPSELDYNIIRNSLSWWIYIGEAEGNGAPLKLVARVTLTNADDNDWAIGQVYNELNNAYLMGELDDFDRLEDGAPLVEIGDGWEEECSCPHAGNCNETPGECPY